MDLWEKVKKGLEGSAATISEKASEWFKSSSEMVKEGADVVSEKASELSRFTKLKWEQYTLQSEIEQEFLELGGRVYDLWSEKKPVILEGELAELIEKIKALESELTAKDEAVEEITHTVYKKNIKEMQADLETSGGTIEQVIITAQCPAVGKRLSALELPREALIGMIVRNEETVIPDGATVLMENDKVTVLGKKEDVEAAVAYLTGPK